VKHLKSKQVRTIVLNHSKHILTEVFKKIKKNSSRDEILTRSRAIAFSFLVSVFPAVVFLLTLLAFVPTDDFMMQFRNSMTGVFPQYTENLIYHTIDDLTNVPRTGLLSVGVLLTVIFSSNGMLQIMRTFDMSSPLAEGRTRSIIRKRMIAIFLTFLILILMIVSILLIFYGNSVINYILSKTIYGDWASFILNVFRWAIVLLMFYSIIGAIYYLGPADKMNFGIFNPGAAMATILLVGTSLLFSFYLNNFSSYNKLYGSLGAILAVFIWVQINSFILLIGFETNKTIYNLGETIALKNANRASDKPSE